MCLQLLTPKWHEYSKEKGASIVKEICYLERGKDKVNNEKRNSTKLEFEITICDVNSTYEKEFLLGHV